MSLFESFRAWLGSGKKAGPHKDLPIVNIERRFERIAPTGQGSMSKVWKARDNDSGRLVCLKVLDKDKTEKFEARFMGLNKPPEGEICMQLRHKNIVQTFEYGRTSKGQYYLVMEFVEGFGLNFLIETKDKMLKGNRVSILSQLADGIEHVHTSGFLHRDICPRNVMVTKDGVVKIIDMGLAIPYKPEFCKPGNRTGTTAYLAPEIITRKATDHRVDMFALGITAYELYTGHTPWEKAESMQVLMNHVNTAGRDPRDLVPSMDEATAKFLLKSIEKDPARRFQNPAEFRSALAKLPAA